MASCSTSGMGAPLSLVSLDLEGNQLMGQNHPLPYLLLALPGLVKGTGVVATQVGRVEEELAWCGLAPPAGR